MNVQRLFGLFALVITAPAVAADQPSAFRYDGDAAMACEEYFSVNPSGHQCEEVTNKGACLRSAAVIAGTGLIANKGRVEGAYLYTAHGSYFVAFPPRSPKFQQMADDCVHKRNYSPSYCRDLGGDTRYFRVELPGSGVGGAKRTVFIQYSDKTASIQSFKEEAMKAMFYKNGSPIIIENTEEPSETWAGEARSVLLADIAAGIRRTAEANSEGNPLVGAIATTKRCLLLFEPGSPGRKSLERDLVTLRKRSAGIDKLNSDEGGALKAGAH